MTATSTFYILAIVAVLLLVATSILATIAAGNINNSKIVYKSTSGISAYQHMTIASALSWTAVVTLSVILIIAAATGALKEVTISSSLLNRPTPTKKDLTLAYQTEKDLESHHTTRLVLFIFLIVIAIIMLVVLIECIIAVVALNNVKNLDQDAKNANIEIIITAVLAGISMGVIIFAIIVYSKIRGEQAKNLETVENYIAKVEQTLSINAI